MAVNMVSMAVLIANYEGQTYLEHRHPLVLSSYLHCEWATLDQLEKDKRIHQKIKRFKTKHAQMRHIFQEVSFRPIQKPF